MAGCPSAMLETMGLRLMNHDPASPAAGIDFNKLPMPCVLPLADVPPAKYAVPHPWTGKFAMNNELQKSIRLFEGKIAGSGEAVFFNLNIWGMIQGCWAVLLGSVLGPLLRDGKLVKTTSGWGHLQFWRLAGIPSVNDLRSLN